MVLKNCKVIGFLVSWSGLPRSRPGWLKICAVIDMTQNELNLTEMEARLTDFDILDKTTEMHLL